ncbi:MAG TPA: DUF1330 domain-containing protein [Casimicrobiaceae bacterium]
MNLSLALVTGVAVSVFSGSSLAQNAERPAFVIVERIATTGPESIQEEYGKKARDILPKFGAHYLARSQRNSRLEGDESPPCCIAILQFPSMEAARRWYTSPENQAATKIRQSGGKFRLTLIEGLPPQG